MDTDQTVQGRSPAETRESDWLESGSADRLAGERLCDLLLQVADALRQMLGPGLMRCSLNDSRFAVLRAISGHGADGVSQTELATELLVSESSICGLVDRMQQDGLLFRFRSKQDRRKCLLMLSESGCRLHAAAREVRRSLLENLFNPVSHTDRQQLETGLTRLLGQLSSHSAVDAGSSQVTAGQMVTGPERSRATTPRIREAG